MTSQISLQPAKKVDGLLANPLLKPLNIPNASCESRRQDLRIFFLARLLIFRPQYLALKIFNLRSEVTCLCALLLSFRAVGIDEHLIDTRASDGSALPLKGFGSAFILLSFAFVVFRLLLQVENLRSQFCDLLLLSGFSLSRQFSRNDSLSSSSARP